MSLVITWYSTQALMILMKIDKGSLLSPFPLNFYGLKIYKPTLREIYGEIGFANYNRYTNLLTMSNIEIEKYYNSINQPVEELEPFLWLLKMAKQDNTFLLELTLAFFTYLKKKLIIKDDKFYFQEDKKFFCLTRENFSDFQKIIRLLNCADLDEDEEEEREIITDNLKMKKKFLEKRKKLKEAKAKEKLKNQQKGEKIDAAGVISALCVYNSGYNMMNVWDLTIYQLYNQFQKSQKKEKHDNDYSALLAGADSKKIKLTNWIKD